MGDRLRRAKSRMLCRGSVMADRPLVGHVCGWGVKACTVGVCPAGSEGAFVQAVMASRSPVSIMMCESRLMCICSTPVFDVSTHLAPRRELAPFEMPCIKW